MKVWVIQWWWLVIQEWAEVLRKTRAIKLWLVQRLVRVSSFVASKVQPSKWSESWNYLGGKMNFLNSISQLVNDASTTIQGQLSPKPERRSLPEDEEKSRQGSFLVPPLVPGSSRSNSPVRETGLKPPSGSSSGSRYCAPVLSKGLFIYHGVQIEGGGGVGCMNIPWSKPYLCLAVYIQECNKNVYYLDIFAGVV